MAHVARALNRRCCATCAVTLRSDPWWPTPPSTAVTTRTGSASLPRSGSPASPWRTGALFPLTTTQTCVAGWPFCVGWSHVSIRRDAHAQHPGSSNARCPSGTSNAPTTPAGHIP